MCTYIYKTTEQYLQHLRVFLTQSKNNMEVQAKYRCHLESYKKKDVECYTAFGNIICFLTCNVDVVKSVQCDSTG
jgi:hypothetical protein